MEKKEIGIGFTLRTILICIIAIAISFYINLQHWGFLGLEAGLVGHIGAAMHYSYGIIFIYIILTILSTTLLRKRPFTPAEYGIFAAVFFMTGDFPYTLNRPLPLLLGPYASGPTEFSQWMPDYWYPKEDVSLLAGAYVGGQSVPGALAPYIAYWSIVAAFAFLITFFTVSLFRKPFVELERLPFPLAVPVSHVANAMAVKGGEEGALKAALRGLGRYFYTGFLFGVLVSLPCTINYIYPFFQSFFVWGQIFITPLAEWQWSGVLNVPDWPMFIPADIALLYFIPMSVLHTALLANILLLWVYPIVATTTGLAAPGTFPTGQYVSPMSYPGIYMGLALWAIFFHRGYLKDTIVAAVRRRRVEGDLPATWLIGGLALSFIVWIALMSATGVPLILAIVGTLVFGILVLGSARLVAELGIWPGSPGAVYGDFTKRSVWATGQSLGYFPPTAPVNSREALTSFAMTDFIMSPDQEWASGGWGMLQNWGLADQTGTRPKDMFKGQLLGIIVGSILLYPIALWLFYAYGLHAGLPAGFYYGPLRTGVTSVPYVTYDAGMYTPTEIAMMGGGIVLVFLIYALRTRFPWMFLHPAGLGMAWSNMFTLMVVPAWILKFVTLKVGGSKGYEKVGVPAVVGFLFGIGLGATLGMLGIVTRYIMGLGKPIPF